MSLFARLRNSLGSKKPEPLRTVPKPVPVNLADLQRNDGYFVEVDEWSTLTTAPPRWELPELAEQILWIDTIINDHARSGTLDGLVPDLLDRPIAHQMAEVRAQIENAHIEGSRLLLRLNEQAIMARQALAREIEEWQAALACAELGYARAYEELTWELPPGASGSPSASVDPPSEVDEPLKSIAA